MRISIGSDHAGFELKEKIKTVLRELQHEVRDEGTTNRESVDYPDLAAPVAQAVARRDAERGILVCGSGIGMAMAANKVPGVRAATCHNLETARLSRRHNDANVLTLGSRTLDHDLSLAIVREWLQTPFDGGRHERRVQKIAELEKRLTPK